LYQEKSGNPEARSLPRLRSKYVSSSFFKVAWPGIFLLSFIIFFLCSVLNETYVPHGKKVVDYYVDHEGIIPLERLWRQNFLDKMQPKFLPPLWSVDHQKLRLDIRWSFSYRNRIHMYHKMIMLPIGRIGWKKKV
jgi:hypothetical protein